MKNKHNSEHPSFPNMASLSSCCHSSEVPALLILTQQAGWLAESSNFSRYTGYSDCKAFGRPPRFQTKGSGSTSNEATAERQGL